MQLFTIETEDYRGRYVAPAVPLEPRQPDPNALYKVMVPEGTTHVRVTHKGEVSLPIGWTDEQANIPVVPGCDHWFIMLPEALDALFADPDAYVWVDEPNPNNEDVNDVR